MAILGFINQVSPFSIFNELNLEVGSVHSPENIPIEMQGRVFAARNSFQFFTIPLGYFLGGLLVDRMFEPIMAIQESGSALVRLFSSGKGSGAAFLFAILWLTGIGVCVIFRADRHIWSVEPNAVWQKIVESSFLKNSKISL